MLRVLENNQLELIVSFDDPLPPTFVDQSDEANIIVTRGSVIISNVKPEEQLRIYRNKSKMYVILYYFND